ncbi:hypothetical protein F4553_002676 [Allocatelliglobosispora scoriae]|uniref:Mycodextranase n=1 Tax=Allocatelliglobosispora scoriae TaxID=643052 RepID=A0A841BJL0_9ACTN|nr:glycosyl hydrolase family 28-related protein [Allocatelliglobosispora scoriae]MBB5869297.1 hypothetical protein [Allocatelliglobosispora scoriae]
MVVFLLLAGCSPAAQPEPEKAPPAAFPAFAVSGRGATVPFVEHEAEAAERRGTLIGPDRTAKTLAAEASGRMAVTLGAVGDEVTFVLVRPANAMTVRYSIPDSPDGKGLDATLSVLVDGTAAPKLPVTSRYSWYYGGLPFTNNPPDGKGHHFYDHARMVFDKVLPTGTRVTLRKESSDTAPSYTVDLADFEEIAPPAAQPAGSVSITDFGADPTGKADSGAAIEAAIAAAKGKVVWLPPGTFQVTKHIIVDRVTLRGAGMWHTTLHGDGVGIYGKYVADGGPSRNVHLSGFTILGEVTERDDADQVNGVGGALGGGSVVEGLWIQHTKVGLWLDGPFDGLTVRGNRILDQTADGLNLHRGITNTVVEHNLVRNVGDDGLAMWSDEFPDTGNVFRFNTIQVPLLANGIAIYGGKDNTVSDNVVADIQIEGAGIQLANRFSGTIPFDGSLTVARNTLLRAGSTFDLLATKVGAIWIYAEDIAINAKIELTENEIIDPTFGGLQLFGSRVTGLTVKNLRVVNPVTQAVQLQTSGEAALEAIRVTPETATVLYYCPDAGVFTTTGDPLPAPTCGT